MTKHEELIQRAEALSATAAELTKHAEDAIAAIDAAEARRVEAHKRHIAAIDALIEMLKPKGTEPTTDFVPRGYDQTARDAYFAAKKEHPVGIAFIEGVGVREVKP